MFQLILPVGHIPEGMTCYKVTGTTPFEVKDKIRLYTYGPGNKECEVIEREGMRFLVSGSSVSMVSPEVKMRLDFKDVEYLYDFVGKLHEKLQSIWD